jgi:hypothetical protein
LCLLIIQNGLFVLLSNNIEKISLLYKLLLTFLFIEIDLLAIYNDSGVFEIEIEIVRSGSQRVHNWILRNHYVTTVLIQHLQILDKYQFFRSRLLGVRVRNLFLVSVIFVYLVVLVIVVVFYYWVYSFLSLLVLFYRFELLIQQIRYFVHYYIILMRLWLLLFTGLINFLLKLLLFTLINIILRRIIIDELSFYF